MDERNLASTRVEHVEISATDLNQRLAQATVSAIDAEKFYIAGKSKFWRFAGIGLIGLAIGGATGLGFFGYARIKANSTHFDVVAASFAAALAKAELKASAEGTVLVEPNEITLAKEQTISLAPNSTVSLSPGAAIRAEGEITVHGPALAAAQRTTSHTSGIPPIENFTVFKSVPYGKGTVQTGWVFLTSSQPIPNRQYCYYSEASDVPGRNISIDIAADEKIDNTTTSPSTFDVRAAFAQCVWFGRHTP